MKNEIDHIKDVAFKIGGVIDGEPSDIVKKALMAIWDLVEEVGEGLMIIDCISDLHGFQPELKGGDLLIVAGDLTARHTPLEMVSFLCWIEAQEYKKKIYIAGNHDTQLVEEGEYKVFFDGKIFSMRWPENIEYLCDSGTEFEGLKIWGTPWTKRFPGINTKCMAFTCDTEEELMVKFALIPDDTDILISHGPPFFILDEIETGNVGSLALLSVLERSKPKLHVFGHIHENGSKQLIYKRSGYGDENNTQCINASYVNERYKPVNPPIRIVL